MRNHVGVHLPSKTMRVSALTEKDKEDLQYGLSAAWTTSRCRSCAAPTTSSSCARSATPGGSPRPIIAKIETPDALENLESIVAASDGVMVARGDLGVEFPPERVPVIQRQILGVARRVRRPVIVATEMLQSMTKSTRPTRAEASDVANAVYSGTDALMLSGETATGDYPTLAASMMSRIAMEAEKSPFYETARTRAARRASPRPSRAAPATPRARSARSSSSPSPSRDRAR
jgi:pyruvate kinase